MDEQMIEYSKLISNTTQLGYNTVCYMCYDKVPAGSTITVVTSTQENGENVGYEIPVILCEKCRKTPAGLKIRKLQVGGKFQLPDFFYKEEKPAETGKPAEEVAKRVSGMSDTEMSDKDAQNVLEIFQKPSCEDNPEKGGQETVTVKVSDLNRIERLATQLVEANNKLTSATLEQKQQATEFLTAAKALVKMKEDEAAKAVAMAKDLAEIAEILRSSAEHAVDTSPSGYCSHFEKPKKDRPDGLIAAVTGGAALCFLGAIVIGAEQLAAIVAESGVSKQAVMMAVMLTFANSGLFVSLFGCGLCTLKAISKLAKKNK